MAWGSCFGGNPEESVATMMGLLQGQIDGQQFLTTLIILMVIAYFLYKEYPEFKKRIASDEKKASESANVDKELNKRMDAVEKRLEDHQEMLSRDYKKLNALEDSVEINRQISYQTLEEMEIIMRALLGALGGLQELGANEVTKEARKEINEYLSRVAHKKLVTGTP